jgi:hypothetical protein
MTNPDTLVEMESRLAWFATQFPEGRRYTAARLELTQSTFPVNP